MKKYIYSALIILIIATTLFSYKKIQLLSRPNIIFIVLDAARADHLSCYGYPKNTTPCIDAIAKKSIVFENNFSQGTGTQTSLSSIFFSRYFTLNALEDDSYIWGIKKENPEWLFKKYDPEQIFLTKIFSMYSYTTAIFSDHSFHDPKSYFTRQFDIHLIKNKDRKDIQRDRDFKINNAIPGIISLLKENKNRRSFVYWHIFYPHGPYPPGAENKELMGTLNEKDIAIAREKFDKRPSDSAEIFNEEELKCLKVLYDSNLRYADSLVGILYENLKKSNLINNTLIILTSDHGEYLGEHNMLTHGNIPFDPVIKTPLIIYYHKLVKKEIKIEKFTESIDIAPTIFDICKIKPPEGKSLDGISLLKYLNHKNIGKKTVFGSNYMRTAEYKYVPGQDLLYDLKKDPEEKNDVSQKELAIKEKLLAIYKQTMGNYKERYQKSIRNTPPDYPFYIPILDFKIKPNDAIEKYSTNYSSIDKTPTDKTWLLNTGWQSEGLYFLPNKNYLAPVTLSTNMPNGTYGIYLMLESMQTIDLPLNKFGLKYRFKKESSFDFPFDIKLFGKSDNRALNYYTGSSNYYLYFGKTEITDNKFSIEIDFQPNDENIYIIKHIKFIPLGVSDNPVKNKDFQEKLEELKSLGYL